MKAEAQNPSFQDLLDHAGWIRALARSLVSDPSLADDVVQDTWVAALKKPPVQDENLRGWLATVVRNAVRMRGRSAARRADHETRRVQERDDALPSSEELAERIETQQRLAARVLQLDEPYRETVLLRYYEGLSSAEIARRTGTKAGTVRWRLSQGLEQLRDLLDDDFGGDRAAWLGLLLPFAEKDVALAASAATGTGLFSGILAMHLGIKLTLGSAALVVAYLLSPLSPIAFDLPGSKAALPAPVEVTFQPLPKEEQAEPLSAGVSADSRVSVAAEAPDHSSAARPKSGFRAKVVDPEGLPVAGAAFFLPGLPTLRAQSDSAGIVELRLKGQHIEQSWFGTVQCAHSDFVTRELEAQPALGQVIELGEITLQPAGAIEGWVIDADGRPLPDAWVRRTEEVDNSREEVIRNTADSLGQAGVTDEQGRFVLENVPTGEVHLWASVSGLGPDGATPAHEAVLSGAIEVRRGQISTGVELQLGRPNSEEYITGVVVDPNGVPLPHAKVSYRYRGRGRSGNGAEVSTKEGRFILPYVPRTPWELRASDREGRYGDASIREARGGEDQVLRLRAPELMALTITGDGPLENLAVWGSDPEGGDRLVRGEEVQYEGQIARFTLPAEPFILRVTAAGHDVTELGPFNGLDAPRETNVALTSLPGVKGFVFDAEGNPLPGVTVELYERVDRRTEHNGFLVRVRPDATTRAETNEEGEFDLTLRKEGEFYLRAEAPGFAPSELGPYGLNPSRGRDDLEVTMGAGGAIEGQVSLSGGSTPAGSIVAISRGDAKAVTQRVNADGTYRFDRLVPGPWHVKLVDAEILEERSNTSTSGKPFSEADFPIDLTVEEGKTTRHDLRSGTSSILLGTVRLDGTPAKDWKVALVQTGNGGLSRALATAQVDAEGRFNLQAPDPGSYTAQLTSPNQIGFTVSEDLNLAPGENRWDLDYATGSLRIENVIPAGSGPDKELDVLIGEDGQRFVIVPLLTPEDGVVLLKQVPAVSARVARLPFASASLSADPRTAGRTQATFEIVAGEETVVRLPD